MVATEATSRGFLVFAVNRHALCSLFSLKRNFRENRVRQLEVVGHHDQNGALVSMKLEQEGSDRLGGRAIEVPGGFVAQQKFRLADQRPGQSDSLSLAAG